MFRVIFLYAVLIWTHDDVVESKGQSLTSIELNEAWTYWVYLFMGEIINRSAG